MHSVVNPTTYPKPGSLTMPHIGQEGTSVLPASLGERRVVTILFCDVAGSTTIAEILDPEEWAELMNEAFEHLIRPIERYDGTVTRLMGDAVLALFGAPNAHADDPQRAILAAMEIVQRIQGLRERLMKQRGIDFNVRIGINTGLVVVGTFGSHDLVEYTAMGDAINVASRIQQLAEPGTIRVGETTHQLSEQSFDFEPLGAGPVRGKREPESTYRVIAPRLAADGFSTRSQGEMPFTGRGQEMKLLKDAVDDLRFNGRGRLIVVEGEAGVGKTRLVAEFLRHVKSLPDDDGGLSVSILENQISPYDAARPYAGLQARFRKVFGIEPDDPPAVVRQKFIERSKQFPPDFRERAARVIQRVMALDLDGKGDTDFDRDEFRSELRSVVLQIVSGWNPGGAFMLVGEDYHWGDPASLQVVADLYELVEHRPVIFFCTYRPEIASTVTEIFRSVRERYMNHLIEIRLEPLSSADMRELVRNLIEGDSVEAENLRDAVQQKSEGNPLFAEEILHAMLDQGAITPPSDGNPRWQPASGAQLSEITLPSNLRALLLERIDRLPNDARRSLQQASVIGRTFSRQVLQEIANANGSLDHHLNDLVRAGLVRQIAGAPGASYEFRHALIQDAAYETILLRHRRNFHRRTAEVMESLYPDRTREFAATIGGHYYQADDARAIDWLLQAARQAQSVYEPQTTVDYANRAIEFARRIGADVPANAYYLRGHAYDVLGNYEAARNDLETVLEIARAGETASREWDALMDLGALWAEADYSRAGALYQDGLALAEELDDDCRIAHSLNRVGNWRINIGDPQRARNAHQQAMDIFDRLDDERGLAETLDRIGLASYLSADFLASARYFRQAISTFRAMNDRRGLASSLALLALSGGGWDHETSPPATGQPNEWLRHARESLDISRQIGWRAGEAFALIVIGATQAGHGNPAEAITMLENGLKLARKIGHHQWTAAAITNLGVTLENLLQWEEAGDLLLEARSMAESLGSAYWTRSAVSHLARVHTATDELDRAESLLTNALANDDAIDSLGQRKLWFSAAKLSLARNDAPNALSIIDRLRGTEPVGSAPNMVPELSLLRGQALAATGDLEGAEAEFAAARTIFAGASNRLLLWRIQVERATLFRQLGDEAAATTEAANARRTIHAIAEQLPDARRRRFLDRAATISRLSGANLS